MLLNDGRAKAGQRTIFQYNALAIRSMFAGFHYFAFANRFGESGLFEY